MYIEYIPVIIMLIPIRIMVKFDQENNDMVMNNSPIRLIEGGRARLARLAISHHVAISGKYHLKSSGHDYSTAVDPFVVGVC